MKRKRRSGKLGAAILITAVSFVALAPARAGAAETGLTQTASTEDAKQAQMMQDIMLKMHEQLHKVVETKDPAERERLKQEQLKTTQEFMKQMRENMGAMKGSATMGGAGQPGAVKQPAGK